MKKTNALGKLWDTLITVPKAGERWLGLRHQPELFYVAPGKAWVTDWVGRYITTCIQQQFGWSTHLTARPYLLSQEILHYGEMGAFLNSLGSRHNQRNTIIATIFHGDRSHSFAQTTDQSTIRPPDHRTTRISDYSTNQPSDLTAAVDRFIEHASECARVVTACQIMEQRLLAWGLPRQQVVRIPLGIDLAHFQPCSPANHSAMRKTFGIPDDVVCIGSFQKDGIGWAEGEKPKLVKGPDIFLQVIEQLRHHFPIFVLLSAPARAFMRKGLEKLGVPYRHCLLPNYQSITELYACLDLYLVTSREEGGPQTILESLACGIPVVSSRVGMAPDVIQPGWNGLLAEVEDVAGLAQAAVQVIGDPTLRAQMVANGLESVKAYAWQSIAARYYVELYRPLMTDLCPEEQ